MSVPSSYAQAVEAVENGYPAVCIPHLEDGAPAVTVSILRRPTREALIAAHDPSPPHRAAFHVGWVTALRHALGMPDPHPQG